MVNFPTEFVDQVEVLEPGMGGLGDEALRRLHAKGYVVALGLTEQHASEIAIMGSQPRIVEYCPRDATEKRFATRDSSAEWLKKNGGRAMFVLLNDSGQLEGYGWTGMEPRDELLNFPVTSAFRLGERAIKAGMIGNPFIRVVVHATHELYAPDDGIGLDTWESNRAVSTYLRLGFDLIAMAAKRELRPTLDPEAKDGMVEDRRLYMGYPSELLAK